MILTLDKHCSIELLENAAGDFLGFGDIRVAGIPLRDGKTPLAIRLDTPDGVLYTRLIKREIRKMDGGVDIVFDAHGNDWGRCEYGDDYEQSQIRPSRTAPMVDELTVSLRPASETVRDRKFQGFSIGFRYRSAERKIHRLLLRGTWEIGGTLDGVKVFSQGQCNMPVYDGGTAGMFTTTCLNALDKYGDPTQVSYQLGTRGGLVQPFDFEYAKQGVLFAWWPELDQVCSWSESPVGDHRLHVADEWRFTMSGNVTLPAKHILFHAGELPEHEARNLWWSARELAYGRLRERFDVQATPPRPQTTFAYGTRYGGLVASQKKGSGDAFTFEKVRNKGANPDVLEMCVCGVWVRHDEFLQAIADLVLPRMAKAGLKRFHCEFAHESDVTVLGGKRKLEEGVHGGLQCESVCATHRFFPSEFWGGLKGFRYLADKGHTLGLEIGTWFAPHFSPRSPYFQAHPEWRIAGPSVHPNSGGYGFSALVTADWNTPIYAAVLADMKRWHEEGGLDYLWTDSFSNLGVAQVNYRAAMRPNFAALGRFYHDLQKVGIRSLAFESLSPWGFPYFGIADLRGDLSQEKGAVPGQNDFAWYLGNEDMLVGFNAGIAARERSDEELQRIQFRAQAGGACVDWKQLNHPDCLYPEWYGDFNRLYEMARPYMQFRTLLADGLGVDWTDAQGHTLRWCFKAQPAPKGPVQCLAEDGAKPFHGTSFLINKVYLWEEES